MIADTLTFRLFMPPLGLLQLVNISQTTNRNQDSCPLPPDSALICRYLFIEIRRHIIQCCWYNVDTLSCCYRKELISSGLSRASESSISCDLRRDICNTLRAVSELIHQMH